MSTSNASLYRALPRNSVFNAFAIAWQSLVTYMVVPYLIRFASEARYGLWVLLSTLSLTGALGFLDLGLNGSVVKLVAEHAQRGDRQRAARVVDVAVAIFVPLGLATLGALSLLRPWLVESSFHIPSGDRAIANTIILMLGVQALCEFVALPFSAIAQAFLRFGPLRMLESLKATLFGVLSVLAVRSGRGIETLGYISAGVSALQLPFLIWLARRDLPEWRFGLRFPREEAGPVMAFSFKLMVFRVMGSLYRNMDKLVLGAMLGTVAVKNYDVVYKLHALALMPISFVTPMIVPIASRLAAKNDLPGVRALVLTGSKFVGVLCVPAAAAVYLLAEPLLIGWLGAAEAEHAALVRLFVSYLFFWPLIQIGSNTLIGMDRTGAIMAISVLATTANLVLSVLLTPGLGVAGVMVATLIANGCAFLAHVIVQLRIFELSLSSFLRTVVWNTFVPACACALCVLGLLALHAPRGLFETLSYLGLGLAAAGATFLAYGLDVAERTKLLVSLRGGAAS